MKERGTDVDEGLTGTPGPKRNRKRQPVQAPMDSDPVVLVGEPSRYPCTSSIPGRPLGNSRLLPSPTLDTNGYSPLLQSTVLGYHPLQ